MEAPAPPTSTPTTTIITCTNLSDVIMIQIIIIMTVADHLPSDQHANQDQWQSIIRAWKRHHVLKWSTLIISFNTNHKELGP